MNPAIKVGERGQVTIPKDLRDRYGLVPDSMIEFVEEQGELILRRVITKPKNDHWAKVRGILKGKVKNVDAEIEEMRGR